MKVVSEVCMSVEVKETMLADAQYNLHWACYLCWHTVDRV